MDSIFNDYLFSFREHLKVKNYSMASIAAYSQHLQQFFIYLQDREVTEVKKVNREILHDYQLMIMENKEYTIATVIIKLRSVKKFFEYLEKSNQILINPAEYLQEPKRDLHLPRVVLTETEVRKILEQPNLSTLIGIRDRTIMEVFYSTGIRLGELTKLTIYDCDLTGGFLRVNKGKFAKDRVIPLGRFAVRFLKEYIAKVRPHFTKNNKILRDLFVTKSGSPLSKQVIEIMVREYAQKSGIKKKVTPHVFRHTFATQLVKNGAEITAVQKMLGHKDLRVTHIYAKVAGKEIKQTHGKAHPRERDKAEKEKVEPQIHCIRGCRHD